MDVDPAVQQGALKCLKVRACARGAWGVEPAGCAGCGGGMPRLPAPLPVHLSSQAQAQDFRPLVCLTLLSDSRFTPCPPSLPKQVFKLKFLLPYLDRLLRLADNKTLRAELTAFPLGVR